LAWKGLSHHLFALSSAFGQAISSPVFDGDVKRTDRAQVVNFALLSSMVYLSVSVPLYLFDGTTRFVVGVIVLAMLFIVGFLYFIFRLGHVEWSGGILILVIFLGIAAIEIGNGTVRSPATVAFLYVIITAGIIFEWTGLVLTVVACSLLVAGMVLDERAHMLPVADPTVTISNWFTYTFLFVVLGSLGVWTHKTIRVALEKAQSEIARRTRVEGALVSEMKESEQTRLALSKELAMKDRLFAILAHDLRGSIGNLSSLLALVNTKKIESPEVKELLEEGDGTARQTYALLENLLDWISNQASGVEAQMLSFQVREVLQIVRDWMQPPSSAKGLTLELDCSENLTLVTEAKILETILRNYVSNAIKYSPPGSTITLRGYTEEGRVVVSVVDQGVGIRPTVLSKLFGADKINSADGTNQEKGTGLGLVFCADLARIAGGHLKVESVLGTGSVFSFVHDETPGGPLTEEAR
jgi:signal transduction histidine kinase